MKHSLKKSVPRLEKGFYVCDVDELGRATFLPIPLSERKAMVQIIGGLRPMTESGPVYYKQFCIWARFYAEYRGYAIYREWDILYGRGLESYWVQVGDSVLTDPDFDSLRSKIDEEVCRWSARSAAETAQG